MRRKIFVQRGMQSRIDALDDYKFEISWKRRNCGWISCLQKNAIFKGECTHPQQLQHLQ